MLIIAFLDVKNETIEYIVEILSKNRYRILRLSTAYGASKLFGRLMAIIKCERNGLMPQCLSVQ